MSTIVRPGQTLHDIAIQYLGSAEAVFGLAKLNGLDIEADLVAGQVLDLPTVSNKRVRRLFKENGWMPAADVTGAVVPAPMNNRASAPKRQVQVVRPGQTLYDLAIQYLGSAEGVFSLAKLNGLNADNDLTPGQVLDLPAVIDAGVVRTFADNGYFPAAGTDTVLEGIGYWGIAYTFEVQ